MMIRRQVFEDIGLMDEGYFMYYEEMDFCFQASKVGWLCWYVPDSRVIHLVGQSSGVTNTKQQRKRMPQYVFDSRRRYFLKNYGWFYLLLADLAIMLTFLTWQVRRILQQKPDLDPPHLLLDVIFNSFFFRGFRLSTPPLESAHSS
jgi:GT2 family glycosyltransferase